MPDDLLKLRPNFFGRPFDSRYRLALRVVADDLPAPARGWADAVVERAAAALRGDAPDAGVEAALRLRQGRPALDRGELEGRILNGNTAEVIAAAMNMPTGVVEVYEALFFDVRTRSVEDHWRAAGGAAVGYGVTEHEALIRWAGFKGIVASVARYFRLGRDKPAQLEEGPDLAGEELETMRSCRRWLETMALSVEDPIAVIAYQYGIKLPPARSANNAKRQPTQQARRATTR